MTVVTGRRRIGKTRLLLHSLKDEKYLYFFVARKDEKLLCAEYTEQIKEVLAVPIFGEMTRFKDIFGFLLNYAKTQPLNLVIDEFQEFQRIDPAIYSDLQNLWDRNKEESKMNLLLSGSVYSLMSKIFENSKEPLFGRANARLFVQPFSAATQLEILTDHNTAPTADDVLAFYILTGGIPKYIEQFTDSDSLTRDEMLHEILQKNSVFLQEGKYVLIEEFGKEYTVYFSVLSLIAAGNTSRSAIESVLQKDIGGYLSRLENDYRIIKKHLPIFAKPGARNSRYFIKDNFLNFWFRFIYKYSGTVETANFAYLRGIIDRDFSTFSGLFLERYFKERLAASGNYSRIGSYWEKGNQNEIDIVAVSDRDKTALIAEVKINMRNYSEKKLTAKSERLRKQLKGYAVELRGFGSGEVL